jgi:hypothetical protein
LDPSQNLVRIKAPKKTAEMILQEIYTALDTVQTRNIDARKLSFEPVSPLLVEEAGRITKSVVKVDKSGDMVCGTRMPCACRFDAFS